MKILLPSRWPLGCLPPMVGKIRSEHIKYDIFIPLPLLPARNAMFEISDKGPAQKKLQRFVMSAKLSLARQKSRESRKVQVKNGLRTGSTLLARKNPVGCSGGPQVSSWKARQREQRTHQKRAVGKTARWRPWQPGFLLLTRPAEGLLPQPGWPLQLSAGLRAARCWTWPDLSKHLACPASAHVLTPLPKTPWYLPRETFWNCSTVHIGQILTDCVRINI